MKLKWQQVPVKTQWGDDMVVASVAIDNDHTLSLYCESDQTPKVEAMFAQRTWIGVTDEEIEQVCVPLGAAMLSFTEVARAIEAKLREKNAQPSKPLTDEEIVKITADPCLYIRGGDYRIDIARAIEAAHGIKE